MHRGVVVIFLLCKDNIRETAVPAPPCGRPSGCSWGLPNTGSKIITKNRDKVTRLATNIRSADIEDISTKAGRFPHILGKLGWSSCKVIYEERLPKI